MASRHHVVARASQGVVADAGIVPATRCAVAATCAVICSDDVFVSGSLHQGAHPAGLLIGRANGSPPSASECPSSQSQSSTARGVVAGAISASTSKACVEPVEGKGATATPVVGLPHQPDHRLVAGRPQPAAAETPLDQVA